MWECLKCQEKIEEAFEACWNCGTSRDGVEDPHFQPEDDAISPPVVTPPQPWLAASLPEAADPLVCPRCQCSLEFLGAKQFHEGTRTWDVLGGMWELFKNREHLDVYLCPRCGRVEFFAVGVGEELRPRGNHFPGG
jgi:hypothetical protein